MVLSQTSFISLRMWVMILWVMTPNILSFIFSPLLNSFLNQQKSAYIDCYRHSCPVTHSSSPHGVVPVRASAPFSVLRYVYICIDSFWGISNVKCFFCVNLSSCFNKEILRKLKYYIDIWTYRRKVEPDLFVRIGSSSCCTSCYFWMKIIRLFFEIFFFVWIR